MTAGQEDRFSLFLTVEAACQRHQAVWDTDFPAFAQAFAKFQEHVAEIGRLAADQRSAIRGTTRQKVRTRRAMEDRARQLGGALAAWAEVNGQHRARLPVAECLAQASRHRVPGPAKCLPSSRRCVIEVGFFPRSRREEGVGSNQRPTSNAEIGKKTASPQNTTAKREFSNRINKVHNVLSAGRAALT